MSRLNDNWGHKIHSDDLRQFAASNAAESMSVLIEIEAPDAVVEFAAPPQSGHVRCNPLSISTSLAHHRDEQSAIEQTHNLLQTLAIDYHFLRGARVFVVNATPDQLRQITAFPTVRAVMPNHVHKVSLPTSAKVR